VAQGEVDVGQALLAQRGHRVGAGALPAAFATPRVAVIGVWMGTAVWTLLWAVALARALAGLPLLGL
jgi:hypothetical protein